MIKRDLLKELYTESEHSKQLVFSHADKIWVMPEDAVEIGMDMYQPSSKAGECLKKKVVKKHKPPFYARGSKIEIKNIELSREVKKQVEELLGIYDFNVATYMGDTSTSQNDKAVLQLYGDDEIYAYVKVTTNEENAKRFEKEANALKYLREAGIEYVPGVLGVDLTSEIKMFAQSTEKSVGQKVRLTFDKQILDTVKDIEEKTKQNINYKDSDFCKAVDELKENLNIFDEEQKAIVNEAIKKVEEADFEFAFSHGDLTPWNVYYAKDEIRLFDFEYCSNSMPAYIDVFHYLSQMILLGKRYTAQCVMREYEHQFDLISEYVEDPKLTYICYLVSIISFYIKRSESDIERIREKLDVWVEMLEYLVKYL